MSAHLYLVKDSDALVSHCKCASASISFPPQMSCPWCGCGWLFSCIDCRKAFTFARAVQTDIPWEALALRDLTNGCEASPAQSELDEWVEAMRHLHADLVLGARYVCLDGSFIPADAPSIAFSGWHATHIHDFVPQVAALSDPSVLTRILANPEYWAGGASEDERERPAKRVVH